MWDQDRMNTPAPFLHGPLLSKLPFLQVVVEQEAREIKEPRDGNGAKEVRDHLRKEMEDVGAVE